MHLSKLESPFNSFIVLIKNKIPPAFGGFKVGSMLLTNFFNTIWNIDRALGNSANLSRKNPFAIIPRKNYILGGLFELAVISSSSIFLNSLTMNYISN